MKTLFKITVLIALLLTFAAQTSLASKVNPDKGNVTREDSRWKAENIKVSTHGKIEFNDDYTDVISISDDGYLKISMTSFGMKRKLYFRSNDGQLDKLYYEGRKQIDFEPEGRNWMMEILPKVVRNSGLDLKNRVNKLYKKGGVEAFLAEFKKTDSDYFKSRMVHHLLNNNSLEEVEKQKLLQEFPKQINSDYELSQILKRHNQLFINSSDLSHDFFNSLNVLSSDYELSQVLSSVFKQNELNDHNFEFFISAMDNINSDYEKANLIKLAISKGDHSNSKMDLILNETNSINSDYEKGIIIKSVINGQVFDFGNIDKIMEISQGISSDYESTKIMKNMIKHDMINSENKDKFKEMMNNISSDYSYKEVLTALMDYEKLGDDKFDFLIDAAENISSPYELSHLYKKMLNDQTLSISQQIKLIESADNISSTYEYSSFLLKATQKLDMQNTKIQKALIDAAQKINSEYDYGKIMKAIYSHKKD